MAIFWGSPEARIHSGTSAVMDDTVDYTDSNDAIHVDMGGTLTRGPGKPPIFGGYAEGDRLFSIEFVWGSEFGDILAGDGVANGLFGYVGNDTITGGAGNDTLRGEAGGDTVSGEAGNDVVYGDDGNDTVSGNAGNDTVFGGMGDDTVNGDMGADLLWGGKGADLVVGGDGADTLEGGLGADMLYADGLRRDANGQIAGPGPDEAGVNDVAAYTLSNAGVVVDLSGGYMSGTYATRATVSDGSASGTTPRVTLKEAAGGHAAGDVLFGVANLIGSAHADTLVGDGAANTLWGGRSNDSLAGGGLNDKLWGGAGNDTLSGGAGGSGNDTLVGGPGADSLSGGGNVNADSINGRGGDYVSYEDSPAGVTINLNLLTAQQGPVGGYATGDTIGADVEDIIGSPFPDLLIGRDGLLGQGAISRNVIRGGPGDDWDDPKTALKSDGDRADAAKFGIFGGQGNDGLYGDDGNDLISGGAHSDDLFGGPGNDWLHGGSGTSRDWLDGGDGNDWLDGGGGNDSLAGGAGNDTLVWDAADQTVSGGDGIDTFDASHTTHNFNAGVGATNGIENFIGGSGNNRLDGNADKNRLEGGGGNDTLRGMDGNDTLVSGTGDDRLEGGNGVDHFIVSKKPADTGSGNRETTSIPDWALGEKIDISAFGLTAAQLATALRTQGTGANRLVDFGAGNGEVAVTLPGGVTGLAAEDFIL